MINKMIPNLKLLPLPLWCQNITCSWTSGLYHVEGLNPAWLPENGEGENHLSHEVAVLKTIIVHGLNIIKFLQTYRYLRPPEQCDQGTNFAKRKE